MAGLVYADTSTKKLEDQAAASALNTSHKEQQRRPSVLDEDGKLSSASAATSLKYARAQDLPSFPSAGLKMSSAGAAASLADSNKKNFEHWKPGTIPAANRAALLAKDYEMDPLWQPEMSAAGSKAAILAHRDTESVEIWKSKGTAQGQSAAGQAVKTKMPNAITERNVPADGHRKAMLAATGAMAGNRARSGSLPTSKADSTNWALKAATTSHKGAPNSGAFAPGDPGFEASRVQNLAKNNVNRQMYGSTPPVSLEVEEKNRQDTLRASAVAMAKKMYAIQQSHIDEAAGRKSDSQAAATSSHGRDRSDSVSGSDAVAAPAPRYENLEEAARKLAQERLAKLHDEHAEYRQYYGAAAPSTRSRFSVRGRRRASIGGGELDSSDDEEQSRRIKKQMSLFQSKLADVDDKKRQSDRDALLQAAHRNVEARMAKMDEKVFQETGKASPAQLQLWEQQARERAQKNSDVRMENVGKVHIGGGKYLDQSEIDAIAKARLQPTLDEISETAERQRARDEEIRLEIQRAQEQTAKEKAREAETKAEIRAAQEVEKLEAKKKKDEEKQAEKEKIAAAKQAIKKEREEKEAAAEVEKAHARAEKDRAKQEKEDNRKSAEIKPGKFNSLLRRKGKEGSSEVEPASGINTRGTTTTSEAASVPADGSTVHDQVTQAAPAGAPAPALIGTTAATDDTAAAVAAFKEEVDESFTTEQTKKEHTEAIASTLTREEGPASPTKRESKVKSWFKTQFMGSGKPANEEEEKAVGPAASQDVDKARDESIRDVAMAGKETDDLYDAPKKDKDERPVSPIRGTEEVRTSRSSSVSSYSVPEVQVAEARPLSGTEHTAQVGRTGMKAKLMKKIKPNKEENDQPRQSFVTATTTDDDEDQIYEEAKDRLGEDELAPTHTSSSSNAPATSRTSHEHSKFKEDL